MIPMTWALWGDFNQHLELAGWFRGSWGGEYTPGTIMESSEKRYPDIPPGFATHPH